MLSAMVVLVFSEEVASVLMAWRIVICWGGVNVGDIKVENFLLETTFGGGGTFTWNVV